MAKASSLPCPKCLSRGAVEASDTVSVSIGSRICELKNVPQMHCDACGERFYSTPQLKHLRELTLTLRKRLEPATPTPEKLRSFRERHGLSQARLERLMGLGKKVLVQYETGKRLPTPFVSRFFHLLMTVDGALEVLKRLDATATEADD